MSNLSRFRKSTVAVLTALMLIAIAMPLLSVATAAGAPTASLSVSQGPNGTVITVSGTGFGASEAVAVNNSPINVTIDGHAAGLNVITISASALAGSNPTVSIGATSQLSTTATGVLSGKIILYGLAEGSHTVIISDASTSVVAGTFKITSPSVTVSPATVAAGDSVTVSGSGFPTAPKGVTYTNTIVAGKFAGSDITAANGATTAISTQLSSNVITKGAYTATVSLPAIVSGSAFSLRDAWNNNATTTLSVGVPTLSLSPSSGPVGTVVTATLSGFGPTAGIRSVTVGNNASASLADFVNVTVSEQGTAVLLFTTPTGTNNSQAGVVGAQTVTVTDTLGNVATATFSVTPKVTLTLGDLTSGSSGTTYAPASTTACLFVQASGFKASSVLTITAPANLPIKWTNATNTWSVSPNTYSTTTGRITTDANGAISFVTDEAATPAAAGSYSITISDGTNTVSTIITIAAAGQNIMGISSSSGAKGSTVTVTYFGTAAPALKLDGTTISGLSYGTVQAWPIVDANTVTFTMSASSGIHTISATGFNSITYTVLATSIVAVNPSTASVGTTVTVVGSGFTTGTVALAMEGGPVTATSSALVGNNLIATFNVPNYIPGTYTLSLSEGVNTASGTLAVSTAQIQISPITSTLAITDPVTIAITGSGFVANEGFQVFFDSTEIFTTADTAVGLSTMNTNGGMLLNSGYVIPTTATAGAHTITVIDDNGASATATFTVQPQLFAQAAVRPGAKITVTGNGFAASSLQTLTVNGTATTWLDTSVTPAAALPTGTVVKTTSEGNLMSSVGFTVASTTAAGTLNIVVTDASGNTASTTITILDSPAITLGSTSIVAGSIATGVSIAGQGFTPGNRSLTANLYQGSTLVTAVTLSHDSVIVAADGTFKAAAGITFTLPASVTAGEYTLRVKATNPTETADAAITVLGLPTLTAPATAASGSNVTITVTGLSKITDATFSSVQLVTGSTVQSNQFGNITMNSDFTKTTWFIVPTSVFAGTYLLTISDSNTGLSIQQAITVTPTIALAPTSGLKGSQIHITGTGFAASSKLTATVNSQAVTIMEPAIDEIVPLIADAAYSNATGAIDLYMTVPITATETNTVTITDASGNSASKTFTLTTPTLTLDKYEASIGSTIQILGNDFADGTVVLQVNGQIVTSVPATVTASSGSFMAYVTLPAGLTGNVSITAIDTSNNVGTAYVTVGGSTGSGVPSQTTMTSTAQTSTTSGTATTTFTSGSTVKASFVLQSTSGSRDVVVAVTFQQGAKVYNMASFQTTMTTSPSTVSFSNLLPAGVTGTWTATLQVFAIDGVTPLGVTTLTFTVA